MDVEKDSGLPPPAKATKTKKKLWMPWLIPVIVVINIGVFLAVLYVNDCPKNSGHRSHGKCVAKPIGRFSFQPVKDNPLLGPSAKTLKKMGGLVSDKLVHKRQWWRLLTTVWLHAGVIHLAVNVLSLLVIGLQMERHLGFAWIAMIYLISGFSGSVVASLFVGKNVSVGGSSPLFGLLGAMLSKWNENSNKTGLSASVFWVGAISLAIGLLPFADNYANIGGFISGFLAVYVFMLRPQKGWVPRREVAEGAAAKPKYRAYQYGLCVASLVLLVGGLAVLLIMVFRGKDVNKHCHWCHYLDCVSTTVWNCKLKP